MVALNTLLADLNLILSTPGAPPPIPITSVTDDSRAAGPGTLFVAIEGAKLDGHAFLADVAARGAAAALVSRRDLAPIPGLPCFLVSVPRRALALIAQHLAGDPSHKMLVTGVTGTNGKTTTAYMMESIFRAAGLRPGILTTVTVRWDGHEEVAGQTTPSPTVLADRFARMAADGVQAVAMEVSSHALDQHRVDGIRFRAAALTNFTQDHLDYHVDMPSYRKSKERFFTEILPASPGSAAVLNLDDEAGRAFAKSSLAESMIGYSLSRGAAQLSTLSIRCLVRGGMEIEAVFEGRPLRIRTPLSGLFNAVNCLTAAGLALAAGLSIEAIERGLGSMTGAPGRFDLVRAGQPFPVVVDYAHTPDSLLQLLLNARGLARKRVILVFGCGGDRDPGKRPLMGEAAARLADHIIVTNDNPRTEDPGAITAAIVEGIKSYKGPAAHSEVQLNRRAAIRRALEMARENDCVVIAGKGHEDYQIVGIEKTHFDDREVVRQIVDQLGLARH